MNGNLGKWVTFPRLIIFALLCTVTARVYYRATDDFRVGAITHEISYQSGWDIGELTLEKREEIQAVFHQKFHYLGKGAQSYAFVSDCGNFVVKFFKFKHLRPSWITSQLPSIGFIKNYKKRVADRKGRRLDALFNAYHLAYKVHREGSGLLYIHLNKSDNLGIDVHLVDKLGINRTVCLDEITFVLQERAKTSRDVIYSALEKNDIEKASDSIYRLLDLYLAEYQKGIFDRDHGVLHNTGFIGKRPVHLDVGKLQRDETVKHSVNAQKDLAFVVAKISKRIHERYPIAHAVIADRVKQYIENTFESPDPHLLECCSAL